MSTSQALEPEHNAMVAAMGAELGDTFFALYKEVVWLHAVWLEYRVLYGTSEEKLQVVNRAAGFFFKIVQDELWDAVLLRIARLTDSARTMGKSNLTICALSAFISDPAIAQEISGLVKVALEKSEFAREHRNKRLAHQDLACATDASVSLSGISRRHVEEMLEALRNVMNKLDGHYRGTMVAYERFGATTGAQRLLYLLERAESPAVAR